MCQRLLFDLYRSYILRGRERSLFLEENLSRQEDSCDVQGETDLIHLYRLLFSEECLAYLTEIYTKLFNRLAEVDYEIGRDVIAGLEFLQNIFATAMWKYNLRITYELEKFTREFDRLDLEEEKQRLFRSAQEE